MYISHVQPRVKAKQQLIRSSTELTDLNAVPHLTLLYLEHEKIYGLICRLENKQILAQCVDIR